MIFVLKLFLFYFLLNNSFSEDNTKLKSQIEKIIEKYLIENPEVIIESLENYRIEQEAKFEEDKRVFINDFYENKKYESLPFIGNTTGPIIIVEFIDYNCGYCKKTLQIIRKLLNKNSAIKIVFIDFPILSESSYIAGKAALAAFQQDAYFKYHSELLKSNNEFTESYLIELAKKLNLDIKKFKKDINSEEIKKKLDYNIEFARNLNIRGTPSFIINKKIYPGAYELDNLEEIIKNN